MSSLDCIRLKFVHLLQMLNEQSLRKILPDSLRNLLELAGSVARMPGFRGQPRCGRGSGRGRGGAGRGQRSQAEGWQHGAVTVAAVPKVEDGPRAQLVAVPVQRQCGRGAGRGGRGERGGRGSGGGGGPGRQQRLAAMPVEAPEPVQGRHVVRLRLAAVVDDGHRLSGTVVDGEGAATCRHDNNEQ